MRVKINPLRLYGLTMSNSNPFSKNYTLSYAQKTVNINKKDLTVTVNTDATRIYDGGTAVNVAGKTTTVTGWIGNDGKAGEVAGGGC